MPYANCQTGLSLRKRKLKSLPSFINEFKDPIEEAGGRFSFSRKFSSRKEDSSALFPARSISPRSIDGLAELEITSAAANRRNHYYRNIYSSRSPLFQMRCPVEKCRFSSSQ
ncbi:hypothetical protein AVEN_218567-1 [Araneus ventricosus]|uniref:Uncharacterized protein n=1 Tax=Araneus ventricosus TaxID=182803 RepID=A0A4Y2WCX1_ARAVE|nr:hypothetical protein AVEN_218567-1 [Araneus ventricosus]